MKVIDIDEILEIVDTKFDEVIYKTLNKNNAGWGDVCMFPNTRELFNLKIALINKLNTLKIIKEPKEDEFEEIEKLGFIYNNTYGNRSQHRKSEEPLINAINKLIINQKKIIKKINEK